MASKFWAVVREAFGLAGANYRSSNLRDRPPVWKREGRLITA